MDFCTFLYFCALVSMIRVENAESKPIPFDDNYNIVWGNNRHVMVHEQGGEVELAMDKTSGGAFESKLVYGSGLFHFNIKLPNKDNAGVVTAFYLSSRGKYHDELDFELLGNKIGKPIVLQTNVFANGYGKREQRIHLWFDPRDDFHSYKILWNPYQIVFYVDDTPIRIFKNKGRLGIKYPTQGMRIHASLWNGDKWATDGGRTKTNWTNAPFSAYFQDFGIDACYVKSKKLVGGSSVNSCYGSKYWWNKKKYWWLSEDEHKKMEHVRTTYMDYDYCSDRKRFSKVPPECAYNI